MVLFVCSTAYQLLNAIQISRMLDEESDLIFTTKQLNVNKEELVRRGFFRNVYYWDELLDTFILSKCKTRRERISRSVRKVFRYVQLKKVYESLPNKNQQYRVVFISYMNYTAQCVYYYFKKSGAVLSLYDDGIYSYHCLSGKPSLFRRIANRWLFKSQVADEIVFFYSRDTKGVDVGTHQDIEMIDIPPFPTNLSDDVIAVFGGNHNDIDAFSRRVIFFDQCFDDEPSQLLQQQITQGLFDLLGDELIIKIHPTMSGSKYNKNIAQISSKVPYEVISGLIPQEDKVLISVLSTACFTPFLIKREEPSVILAFNMLEEDNPLAKKYVDVYERFQKEYSTRDKISAPRNLEQLLLEVNKIVKNQELG